MAVVYHHKRLDNDNVFYIGIGKTEKRAVSLSGRSNHWFNINSKCGFKHEILLSDISYEDAKSWERYLIGLYGRRNTGTGVLINLTDGGEGALGLIMPEEARKKMSKAHKGKIISEQQRKKMSELAAGSNNPMFGRTGDKNPRFGKTHTEEARKKISDRFKGVTKTEEHRKKLSESKSGPNHPMYGKQLKKETKEKLSVLNKGDKNPMYGRRGSLSVFSKRVTNGELEWDTVYQAADYFGHSHQYISKMLLGQRTNKYNLRYL